MAERCAFFLFRENDNVKCLICNHGSQKNEKLQKLSLKAWGNFIAKSKLWTNAKPIEDEYSNLTVVYEQAKNLEYRNTIPGSPYYLPDTNI